MTLEELLEQKEKEANETELDDKLEDIMDEFRENLHTVGDIFNTVYDIYEVELNVVKTKKDSFVSGFLKFFPELFPTICSFERIKSNSFCLYLNTSYYKLDEEERRNFKIGKLVKSGLTYKEHCDYMEAYETQKLKDLGLLI